MQNLKKEAPDQWKAKMKQGGLTAINKADMDALLVKFISSTFGPEVLNRSNEEDRRHILNSMMMIVFSHRYSKGDLFIQEAEAEADCLVDFSVIRDVMYKYSKKAQDRYFSLPIESFFFAAFSLSDEGI